MSALDEIVKAYDIRGTVPDQLDAEVARAFGVAFASHTAAAQVLVARDMRPSGPELVAAFTDGVLSQGADVIDIGLASSDLLYYASAVGGCRRRCSRRHTTRPSTTASSCVTPERSPSTSR